MTDASFNGVATTYLVAMPWGQELTVTQPNDGSARANRVHVRHARLESPSVVRAGGGGLMAALTAAVGGVASPYHPRRRGSLVPLVLLAPALLWLLVFFVLPTISLASQSLQTGDIDNGFTLTWNFAIYADALARYWPQVHVDIRLCRVRDDRHPRARPSVGLSIAD